jgi:hypothetical protein
MLLNFKIILIDGRRNKKTTQHQTVQSAYKSLHSSFRLRPTLSKNVKDKVYFKIALSNATSTAGI